MALQSLQHFYSDVIEDWDAEPNKSRAASVLMLIGIRDLRQDLASLAHDIEAALVEDAPRHMMIEGVGEIEVKTATRRTGWQHDALVAQVVARAIDEPGTIYDPETGELLPYAAIGANIAARLRDCVSFGAGKLTGLRSVGLDPDEFCRVEESHRQVVLPRRELLEGT